jgi:hypothetical protein
LNSTIKFLLAAVFCLVAGHSTGAADLTGGIWDVDGIDDHGTSWDASTLLFTSQIPNGADFDLVGYFDWLGSNGGHGREHFAGKLLADSTIQLTGNSLTSIPGYDAPTIVLGNYYAVLESNGNRMAGDWSGVSSGIPGDFTATRLPEPASLTMLAIGCAMIGHRRRQ